MRSLSTLLMIAALSLLPIAGSAAPAAIPSGSPSDMSVLLAQGGPPEGWWEREGRPEELRDRYWRLPPPERYRYNQLEQQIRQLQDRAEQLRREQRSILRWGGY